MIVERLRTMVVIVIVGGGGGWGKINERFSNCGNIGVGVNKIYKLKSKNEYGGFQK